VSAINLGKKHHPKYCYCGFYGLLTRDLHPWCDSDSVPCQRRLSDRSCNRHALPNARVPARWSGICLPGMRHGKDAAHQNLTDLFATMGTDSCHGKRWAGHRLVPGVRFPLRRATRCTRATCFKPDCHKKKSPALNLSGPDADSQRGPPNRPLRLGRNGPANTNCHIGVET